MNTLILDCSAGMNIFLLKKDEEFKLIDTNQKRHTDTLLVSVNQLLEDAKMTIKEIDNICVCVGPGSFTGIRVAVSMAKGLSIGIGAKVFACSNFDIYSFGECEKSIYILDGFSDFVYVRIFDGKTSTDSCEHIDDFITKIKTNYADYKIYVQSEKVQNLLKNDEIASNLVQNKTILCFKDKIERGEDINISSICPIYLRASQAEIERNKKLNGEN